MRTTNPWPILVSATLLVFSQGMAFAGWEAEGVLTYTIRLTKPGQSAKKEFTFRLSSDGCRSLIRTTRVETGDYTESFIAEGTIYTLYHFNRTNLQSGGKPVQTAEVTDREVPRDDSSNIGCLWLAYGSSCYFDSRTTNRLAPLWIQDDPALDGGDFTMEVAWTRHQAERLPRSVAYLNDGLRRTQRGGASFIKPWPAPFDRGFKHAIYEAWEGTNISGAFIPTDFTFARYGVEPDGKGGWGLAVITQTEVKAVSVRESPELELAVPGFAGAVGVADYRFMHSNPAVATVLYQATNGLWPDDKMAGKAYEKQARMQEKLSKAGQSIAPNTDRRSTALVLLVFTSVGGLLVILWMSLRRNPGS